MHALRPELVGHELLPRQVDLMSLREPIPVMDTDYPALTRDIRHDQVAAQPVLDYQRSGAALTPTAVVRPPCSQVGPGGVRGLRAPRRLRVAARAVEG